MTRYLLGQLDDRESQELEESFFSDDEIFDALVVVEGDLIEAYLHGELTDEEREQFEQQMEASPERRSRVETVRLLTSEAQSAQFLPPASGNGGSSGSSGSGFSIGGGDLPVGKPGRRTLYRALPAAACLVMAILAGWSWRETTIANERQAALQESLQDAVVPTEMLLTGTQRSNGSTAEIITVKAERALVEFELHWEGRPRPGYLVELTHRASGQRWLRYPRPVPEAPLIVGFSSRELPEGDYILKLHAEPREPEGHWLDARDLQIVREVPSMAQP
jgi:hypothetical protein